MRECMGKRRESVKMRARDSEKVQKGKERRERDMERDNEHSNDNSNISSKRVSS